MAVLRPEPLSDKTAHITTEGKPTKDFFNWLKKGAAAWLTADSTDALTNKTITDSTDTLGGVTMLLGSDAKGDIYYRSAGGILTRLPIGSATNVLTVSGGLLPSWAAAPASGLNYLGTVNVSSNALVDTTILAANSGTYRSFQLMLKNIIPGTNSASLGIQVHSGGAFKTTSYLNVVQVNKGAGIASLTSTTAILMTTADVKNADPGLTGLVTVSDLANAGISKQWSGSLGYYSAGSTISAVSQFSGFWNGGTGAIDGFQIIPSTGTLSSGGVDIYGIL